MSFKKSLVSLLLLSVISTKVLGDIEQAKHLSERLIERFLVQYTIAGAVAGVSINGTNVWTKDFGYCELENLVKCKPESVFRVASISKALTSSLVGHLVENGHLRFEDSIYDHLAEDVFPRKTWKNESVDITLEQLMAHSGGIRSSQNYHEAVNCETIACGLALFKRFTLTSKPGTVYDYSNYGWNLVGAVIESVINTTFDDFQRSVHGGLMGLNTTLAERLEEIVPNRAFYYINCGDDGLETTTINDQLWSFNREWTSGGYMSTVPDLLKYGNLMMDSYLRDTGFLKQETVKKIWTPFNTTLNGKGIFDSEYGLGWDMNVYPDSDERLGEIFWHTGSLAGLTSILLIVPDYEIVASILTNSGPSHFEIIQITKEMVYNFIS